MANNWHEKELVTKGNLLNYISKWDQPLLVDETSRLYHYTSESGGEGIQSCNAFRIRQLTKLDDEIEGGYGLRLLDSVLSSFERQTKAVCAMRTILKQFLTTYGFCKSSLGNGRIGVVNTGQVNFDRTYKPSIFELSLTFSDGSKEHINEYCGNDGTGFIFETNPTLLSECTLIDNIGTAKSYDSSARPFEETDCISPLYKVMYSKDELVPKLRAIIDAIDSSIELIEDCADFKMMPKGQGFERFEVCWQNLNGPRCIWEGANEFNKRLRILLLCIMC